MNNKKSVILNPKVRTQKSASNCPAPKVLKANKIGSSV